MGARRFLPVLVTALVAVTNTALYATGEGALKITVLKPDRTPVDGTKVQVSVTITSPTQINSGLVSGVDRNGAAYFYKLAPGVFTIRVQAEAYAESLIRTDVRTDQVSHLTVLLTTQQPLEVRVEDVHDILDTTQVATGMNLTQDMLQTFPNTGRIATQALFVPGVYMSPLSSQVIGGYTGGAGEPALALTLMRDRSNNAGYSVNNYLLDGMDMSDAKTGAGIVHLMADLIADIDIKTGGVSAEYSAKSGFFLNATTISGGNEFHGGLSWDSTPNDFRARSKPGRPVLNEGKESYGFFASGPILKDRLWFVAGAQKLWDGGRATLPDGVGDFPGQTRPYTGKDEINLFWKLTWQIDPRQRLIGEFHSNYSSGDNGYDPTWVSNWLAKMETGGERGLAWYSFQGASLLFDIRAGHDHARSLGSPMVMTGEPTVWVFSKDPLTLHQSALGGMNGGSIHNVDRNDIRADLTVPFTTGGAKHTLKSGAEYQSTKTFSDSWGLSLIQSLDQPYTYDESVNERLTWAMFETEKLCQAINTNPAYLTIKQRLLQPGQQDITYQNLATYRFSEEDPAFPGTFPVMKLSYPLNSNPSRPSTVRTGIYLQDYVDWGRLTLSPGIRLDRMKVYDDRGIVTFSQTNLVAPRLGLSWDVKGDARSRLYACFGRYFNPVFGTTSDMVGQTKSSGEVYSIRLFGQWVDAETVPPNDYQSRAPIMFQDGLRMPYTNEYRLGFEKIVRTGKALFTFELAATRRDDKDIVDNVFAPNSGMSAQDLELYARTLWNLPESGPLPAQQQQAVNLIRSLALPTSFFAGGGRDGATNISSWAYLYANMPGAWRRYDSVDVTGKFEGSRWQAFLSFSRIHATGTSNGVAVFQTGGAGLNPFEDPRLPWMNGPLDGSPDWLAKVYGRWQFPGDWILGWFGRADSGFHYMTGGDIYNIGPEIPPLDQVFTYKAVHSMTPRRYQFDLHLEKRFKRPYLGELWLSVNVFNLFNNQSATALAENDDLHTGVKANQPYLFNPPRSIGLSAKLKF